MGGARGARYFSARFCRWRGSHVVGFGVANPSKFLTLGNFSNIFGSQAVLFVLTMALLVPLTNGDIDLSVGSISALVTMVVAVLNVAARRPDLWCCLIGLAVGVRWWAC